MAGGVSCDAGIQVQSVLFYFHSNPETPKSPLNSTNAQEATLGQEKKRQEFLQKPWERQLGSTAPRQMFLCKDGKGCPGQPSKRGQHHGADNTTSKEMGQNTPNSPAWASEETKDIRVCRRGAGTRTWMLKLWDWMKGRVMFL